MKSIRKILKYLLVTITVIFALLLLLSFLLQTRITQIFTNEINKHITSPVVIENVKFSLIRDFPKASVEFKNIRIESPASNNPWLDSMVTGNNLLEAELIFASFNVRDIIKKQYDVEKLSIKKCSLLIYNDVDGNSIPRILKKKGENDTSNVTINLKNLRLEETGLKYLNGKTNFILECRVDNALGKLALFEGKTDIEVNSGFSISNISSRGKIVIDPVPVGDIKGKLIISSDSIYFNQFNIEVDKQHILVDGSIYKRARRMQLNISLLDCELDRLLNYIPGEVNMGSNIFIDKLDGFLALDFNNAARSFRSSIYSYRLKYAGSKYAGSLKLENLSSPFIDFVVNSEIDLEELNSIHKLPEFESLTGILRMSGRFSGAPGSFDDISLKNILSLDKNINLHLNDVEIKLEKFGLPFINMSGNIMIAENCWVDELTFGLDEQNVILNCRIDMVNRLFNQDTGPLHITAGVWTDKFDINSLLNNRNKTGKSNNIAGKNLLDRLSANISLNIDSLLINKFHSSQFDGALSYKSGFLNINSFNILTLDGAVSGNAAIIKNSKGGYLARGWFDIEEVNINETFKVFNNFRQDQILAENIKGDLTGSISISTEIDSSFKPLAPSLSVTGNYSIYNGELLNFEPVLKLSRFIEISELENIRFKDLHNDLAISDSRLMIPSMEINSSAFNISLSGEQAFSGEFEYHLSILLSEILSKKAQNSGSYVNEFGTVEDDGLGRTTLFLKLEKDRGETVVSYDVKKLSTEIKVDLQEEKQNLKTILNEEYGWYNSDSLINKTDNKSKKFRIVWEEADSVQAIKPDERDTKAGLLRKIFKSDTTKKKF